MEHVHHRHRGSVSGFESEQRILQLFNSCYINLSQYATFAYPTIARGLRGGFARYYDYVACAHIHYGLLMTQLVPATAVPTDAAS